MGNFKSKYNGSSKNGEIASKNKASWEQQSPNISQGDSVENLELKRLRRTIEQNPELFILNNLMMSIQFFENYEEEIKNMRQKLVSSYESELNARLPPQKHAMMPDVLQEKVARTIDFTYVRPTSIPTIEPLQPIRIYIVFDNIEVTEQNYQSPYCSVNEAIIYSMQLKPSKHKGYALLQRLEVNPSRNKIYSSCEDIIYSDTDSLYSNSRSNHNNNSFNKCNKKSDKSESSNLTLPSTSDVNDEDSIYEERENHSYPTDVEQQNKRTTTQKTNQFHKIKKHRGDTRSSPPSSVSSGYRSTHYVTDSSSESGYGLTTLYNKSKSHNFSNNTSKLTSELSRQCFQIYDPVKEKQVKLNNKDRLIAGFIHSRKYDVWYLNSSKFMGYFYEIFVDQLSNLMGFDEDIEDEPQGAFIYRDKFKISKSTAMMKDDQFAIVPCIWTPWPEMADEWLERPRGTWPDYDMIEKIKETGCYMIPNGHFNEGSTNNLRNLEWELTFPAAERYLETCLSYSQIRIYMMALMLQKTLMRSLDSYIDLTGTHIRNQLFWLIEDNDAPSRWNDNHMGECLVLLLKSLYRAISQDIPIMPDYFIRNKNIFHNNISLLRTQKQLKRIIENPVMYLLYTMQYIKYSHSFFPKLDYDLLLRILTEDILTLINPYLAARQLQQSSGKPNNFTEKQYERVGFWDNAKQKKENNRNYVRRPVTNKSLIDARTSPEQVIEITVRCAELDSRRLCLLLDLFIKHFIKIAECCHKYGASNQKTIYIDQAEKLSILLSEHGIYREDAKAYLDKLNALRKRAARVRLQSDGPEIPKRNFDVPLNSSSLKDQFEIPLESHQPFIQLITPGETSEYSLNEASMYESKSRTLQQKDATITVHNEDSTSDTNFSRSFNEITVNGNRNNGQNISSVERQRLSDNDNTYI